MKQHTKPYLQTGQFYSHQSEQKIRGLLSYLHPVDSDLTLGVGVKSRWFTEPNNIRHLAVGVKYQIARDFILQSDFFWGVSNFAGDGLTFTGTFLGQFSPEFDFTTKVRAGFFDALVWRPDISVIEIGFLPRYTPHPKFYFELGTFVSTQLPSVSDFFAFDVSPGFVIHAKPNLSLHFGGSIGALGPNKAEPRGEVAQEISF